MAEQKIVITKDGPYIVSGNLPLDKQIIVTDKEGTPIKWGQGQKYPAQANYALCRCGKSKTLPFCDGTHAQIGFDGKEIANNKSFNDQAEITEGPDLILRDAEKYCAIARFCHRAGTTWNLVEKPDRPDAKEIAIQETWDCPSGRLVVCDKKTREPIECKYEPSISLIQDPTKRVSGPVWIKGKVKIVSSGGTTYEARNNVTLCRCGKSKNKPFCDGTHCDINYNDGDESLIRK